MWFEGTSMLTSTNCVNSFNQNLEGQLLSQLTSAEVICLFFFHHDYSPSAINQNINFFFHKFPVVPVDITTICESLMTAVLYLQILHRLNVNQWIRVCARLLYEMAVFSLSCVIITCDNLVVETFIASSPLSFFTGLIALVFWLVKLLVEST